MRKVFALNNLNSGDRFSGELQKRDKFYFSRPHLIFDRVAQLYRIILSILMRIFSNVTHLELFIYQFVNSYKKKVNNRELLFYECSLTFFYLNTFLLLALISEKFQLPLFFFIKTDIFHLIIIQESFCRFHLAL